MLNLFEIRNSLTNGISIYDLPLKVTYYARVSTDKYEQLNSLENQVNYYEQFIKNNTKWIFVDGYLEEGIRGTSVNKREAFKKMIRDAKNLLLLMLFILFFLFLLFLVGRYLSLYHKTRIFARGSLWA